MSWTIWHNPRCSKSRQTLQLLETQGITPTIRLYLSDPPSTDELVDALESLELDARGLIRSKEALFKELGLKDPALSETDLIQAMVDYPKLIERPIVFGQGSAIIGRPPENVLSLVTQD